MGDKKFLKGRYWYWPRLFVGGAKMWQGHFWAGLLLTTPKVRCHCLKGLFIGGDKTVHINSWVGLWLTTPSWGLVMIYHKRGGAIISYIKIVYTPSWVWQLLTTPRLWSDDNLLRILGEIIIGNVKGTGLLLTSLICGQDKDRPRPFLGGLFINHAHK